MKTFLSFIALLMVTSHLYSQEMQPVESNAVKTDYLAKSKKQRTAGWILTGTGIAVTSVGLVASMAQVAEETAGILVGGIIGEVPPETHSKGGGALLITGTALIASGITFLTIAKNNKRKAVFISFINESSQQLRFNTVMNTSVPSVRVRMQF